MTCGLRLGILPPDLDPGRMKVLSTFSKVYVRMRPGRRFAAAATAFSLITAGCFGGDPAVAASDACAEVTVLPSPFAPWSGMALRVMAVAERPVQGTLSLIAPDGSVAVKSAA